MSLPVIVIGGGGHAGVLIDILRLCSVKVLGITERVTDPTVTALHGVPVLGSDDIILEHAPDAVRLVNAIGSTDLPVQRMTIYGVLKEKGYTFASVIHPSAIVASDVIQGEGVQIMAGAVIQPGCTIGVNTIVNTNASVDHDCRIGDHVHLSPGVTLSGNVRIGECAHVGPGVTVIQQVTIGRNCLVGAGAVIINDIPEATRVAGVPAREMKGNRS